MKKYVLPKPKIFIVNGRNLTCAISGETNNVVDDFIFLSWGIER